MNSSFHGRARARELGIHVGILPPGPLNAITDVAGVSIGHRTLCEGDAVRTGVTAILPHDGNLHRERAPGAIHVGNGYGKLAGYTQVRELGLIETPIILTNTLSVAAGIEGLIRHTLRQPGNGDVHSVNALVGETNDGYLNDIRGMHVTPRHVTEAIASATSGAVAEGSVGAGTGTTCYGFKGGIGTASRLVSTDRGGYTVGILVQTNFGGLLTINGAPASGHLGQSPPGPQTADGAGDGSCMIILATDAPLFPRQLERLASRAMLGLARTGSYVSHGSGDYVIAFSTAYRVPREPDRDAPAVALLHDSDLSPLFMAAVEATEEAVYNSLFMAETVTGRNGNTREAIPLGKVVDLCRRHGL